MAPVVETSVKSQHGTWIEARLDRLHANLKSLRNLQIPGTKILAVVKANAYGHGLVEIAKSLAPEADYFGVSSLREAMELREHQLSGPILVFSRLFDHEIPVAVSAELTLSVSGAEEAREISEISMALGAITKIHVKVDTGMGRFGIPQDRALREILKIRALPGITLEGIFTHFPSADTDDAFSESQISNFASLLQGLEARGVFFLYRHGANSAASVKFRTPVFNMIRPGLMLYGIYPDPSLKSRAGVLPVLSLKARVLLLKRLKAGETAGYGRLFKAEKPTTIGIISAGYSHGYPFRAWQNASLIYGKRLIPLAGRVSMDYLAADFGDLPVRDGAEVTLIGSENGLEVRAEDLAAWAGTIPYEILTGLAPSIPRLYR